MESKSYPTVSLDPSKNGILIFHVWLIIGAVLEDLQITVNRWKDLALQKVFCGKVVGRQACKVL